ncbi:class I SAM-dependent methyltransferase [Nocardia wallacei]|uniref:class I SAM-dependent methyltransferase n=1 Tax=Nocardia wallacei TaxID=480035 RepID=UPI0024578E56|nr:methyltransferase domain-containing protein [Nocardia wallacei]
MGFEFERAVAVMPQQIRRRPVFARVYAGLFEPGLERAGVAEYRRRLLAGLSGRVVEVGAGHGPNFGFYPPEVTRVAAVEPEPLLRARAVRAAEEAPVPVEVIDGAAERLVFGAGEFDAAVACMTLCSVADPAVALAELARVVKPGGRLRFFEHVRSESARIRRVQRAVDATVWPLLVGGCHTGRDLLSALGAAGFTVTEVERFRFPDTAFPSPAAEHVLGTAVLGSRGEDLS